MRELIGLKIVAIKGSNKNEYGGIEKNIEPKIVFFDDGETYLSLEEQDYYSYHDCSFSARHLNVYKNKESYDIFFNSLVDSNSNI
jgi:hypothetical protein